MLTFPLSFLTLDNGVNAKITLIKKKQFGELVTVNKEGIAFESTFVCALASAT